MFSYVGISRFFDPMTLIYELDLGILKMSLLSKNEVSRSRLSKVKARTVQTHTHTELHWRVVTRSSATAEIARDADDNTFGHIGQSVCVRVSLSVCLSCSCSNF